MLAFEDAVLPLHILAVLKNVYYTQRVGHFNSHTRFSVQLRRCVASK